MSRLTVGAMKRLKRLARYLLAVPEVELVYDEDGDIGRIDVFTDSDWAGCRLTRRSTSGGVLCVGGCTVKTWAKTQGSLALSSGEAEYYALVKGAAEALGLKALLADLGISATIHLAVDSSAAKSMASRTGLGKVRHMEVQFLWLQERVKRREVTVRKISGATNPADVLTKPKGLQEIRALMRGVKVNLIECS